MPENIYSSQFIRKAGLSGTGDPVEVPTGHVYVVRFVTVYCNSPAFPVTVFFQDDSSGAALLWSSTDEANPIRMAQDCRFVFQAGQKFHFQVDVALDATSTADVSASGFDFLTG